MTRILAVDPALTATGFCVANMLDARVTETFKPKTKGVQRLVDIRGRMQLLLHAYTPDVLVMEGYNYGAARMKGRSQTPGRLFDIGELGGMIKLQAVHEGMKLLIVPPASLKMFATGNGLADKPMVMAAVARQWPGVVCADDNQADAVALYHFAEAVMNKRKRRRYTEKQRSALDGAKWEVKA